MYLNYSVDICDNLRIDSSDYRLIGLILTFSFISP